MSDMSASQHDSEKAHSSEIANDPVPEDPDIVDFEKPEDPENPMNWSSGKKTTQIIIVTSMTLLSPIGSTISAAATLDILENFNSTNQTVGTLVTTIFLIGYTFGPIVIAPLSELYGRAILYKVCIFFFVVFNVACAVSDSLRSLVTYRFLAGVMGSCPVTLSTGSIADMVIAEKRAGAMGAYIIGAVLGPAIGPVIGGYLTPAAGWRWTFWTMAIASGVMTVVSILFVHESYPYVLLERKAQRLRKETGNLRLRSTLDTGRMPSSLFVFSITRPLKMLLSPIVFLLSLYAAIVYSYLYLCFTTFEIVFYGQYGFSSGEAGLATLGIGIGSVLGCVVCGIAANAVSKYLTGKHGGDPKPEYRLPPMILGGLCTPIGLFWYGWSAQARLHWIVPILGTVFIGMGMVFTYMPSAMYLVDAYTVHAASVTAASTIFRCLLGALLPLAGPAMYDTLGLGWGNSLLGFISIAFFPVPFILYLYGERLRNAKVFKVEI
ncbi:major facilitator superfamily domain-containing protein [Alternaria rosae]|uniref:major facilitator superfamily domain-containing protein n=1 Tax=Alternaria rosae TaxID=1187941 RepID=UPI001E8CCE74|nr:major facilitator superfamily domain-containing protein [Alternaria rosae]KAH6870108.1 major facilitator superfamily domain-containing protein [Alternaria rosae]